MNIVIVVVVMKLYNNDTRDLFLDRYLAETMIFYDDEVPVVVSDEDFSELGDYDLESYKDD